MWYVEQTKGYGEDLARQLNRLQIEGWTIRFVLTNGIDSWTIVCWREA